MKKIALVALLALLVTLFFVFDLGQWLTFEALKQSQAQFAAWYERAPLQVAGLYFLLYVVVTALSLPGAAVMTLAGGALFGLGTGLLLVSFASTLGATLAFLVSRYLLRDLVQSRFGERLRLINEGVAKDGPFYLFTLRLVPIFPFFLINLVMGLTPLRVWTFYWVSQIGMLAGTLVYVNAGTQLGQLESAAGIFSPALLLSFALLGIFPLIARRLLQRLQRRRLYCRWRRPVRFDRNLIVIGGGAAGLVSAYIAAAVKAKVTLVEAHRMGGDCLNYGCVPSKALIKSARVAHQLRHAADYGLEAGAPRVSFRRVMERVAAAVTAIEPHDSVERYTRLGVEVAQGYARITDPWTVEITLNDGGVRRLTTRSIIIAAGASPMVPELAGLEEVDYVTSDTLWQRLAQLDEAPRRLVVLGGGAIGCELSQALVRLGSQVTLIQRGQRLLPGEDEEVSALAGEALARDGVNVLTGHEALRCGREGETAFIVARSEEGERQIPFDLLLCAIGRRARLQGYGLEALGIETGRTVVTNDYLETLYPNILAAGDVAGPYQFTHAAAHQAWYAAVNGLFGDLKRFRADYSALPRCTFIDPEVASVGLNEQQARTQGVSYEVTRYGIDDLDRALVDGVARGFVKVLTVPGKDRILGVTIVGEQAGELLAEFVLAMRHGLGLNKILATIHPYPTLSEANKYAAGEWKRNHAPQRLLRWLERYHGWRRG